MHEENQLVNDNVLVWMHLRERLFNTGVRKIWSVTQNKLQSAPLHIQTNSWRGGMAGQHYALYSFM